jgi:anti-sigma regulatory factor (Ser/Thr protein kinase)
VTDRLVRLSFPARAQYLILARLALAGVARAVPMGEEALADLKLAVTEACANVVKHAYENPDAGGIVRLSITAETDAIAIEVEDDGVGPPAGVAGIDAGDGARGHGMGLAIIAAVASDVNLRRKDAGGGTVLTFRKRLAE